jgi:hypothetical protein
MTQGLKERIRLSKEAVDRALDKAQRVDEEIEKRLHRAVDEAKIESGNNQAIGVKAPTDPQSLSGVFYSDLKHADEIPLDYFQEQADTIRDAGSEEKALETWKKSMRVASILPGHNKEFYTDNPEEVVTEKPGQLVEDVEQLQEHHEHVLDKYEDEIKGLDDSLQQGEALVKELNQAKSIIEDNVSLLKSVRDRYVLHDVSVQGIRGDTFGDLVDEIKEHLVNVKRLSKADLDEKADKVSEQVNAISVRVQACRKLIGSFSNLLRQYPTQDMEEIIEGLREQAKALIEQSQRQA